MVHGPLYLGYRSADGGRRPPSVTCRRRAPRCRFLVEDSHFALHARALLPFALVAAKHDSPRRCLPPLLLTFVAGTSVRIAWGRGRPIDSADADGDGRLSYEEASFMVETRDPSLGSKAKRMIETMSELHDYLDDEQQLKLAGEFFQALVSETEYRSNRPQCFPPRPRQHHRKQRRHNFTV